MKSDDGFDFPRSLVTVRWPLDEADVEAIQLALRVALGVIRKEHQPSLERAMDRVDMLLDVIRLDKSERGKP